MTAKNNNRSKLSRYAVLGVALVGLNAFSYVATLHPHIMDDLTHVRRVSAAQEAVTLPTIVSEEPSTPTTSSPPPRPVEFLDMSDLEDQDIFSASWWQSTERFLDADLSLIQNVEADAFVPIRQAGHGIQDVRKTRDYLDFSIEHLSKWWKMTQAPGIDYAIRKLKSYIQRTVPVQQDTLMNTTLALIPYGVSNNTDKVNQRMWKMSLSATIVSLLQHGVPRVVVVGHYQTDANLTAQVFSELSMERVEPSFDQFDIFLQDSGTELAYVQTDNVNSTYVSMNLPKGALFGLQDALSGKSADPSLYLGEAENAKERFEYVYLTEADQILNARLTPDFRDHLDQGHILVPHRLQPIPHAHDLDDIYDVNDPWSTLKFLPPNQEVTYLDADTDGCCDTGEHLPDHGKTCGAFWWQCGFGRNEGDFSHLEDFQFISLSKGTGIVSLAATEQSRRCSPSPVNRGCSATNQVASTM